MLNRDRAMDEVCHKLTVCNAVRDALEGQVVSVHFFRLLLRPRKQMIDYLLEVGTRGAGWSGGQQTRLQREASYTPLTLCGVSRCAQSP